jgi:hypothetical protein
MIDETPLRDRGVSFCVLGFVHRVSIQVMFQVLTWRRPMQRNVASGG